MIDGAGNLYGTTSAAVFKLDTAGKLTTLHSPGAYAGLAMDSAGILYGSSADGIFSLDPSSRIYTVLAPGVGSNAPLALDAAGNLYGTTGFARPVRNCVRAGYAAIPTQRCTPSRRGRPMGSIRSSGVIVDAAGNLYGTTLAGAH